VLPVQILKKVSNAAVMVTTGILVIIHGAFQAMIIMANTDNQILNWGMTVPVSGVILVVSGDVMVISGYCGHAWMGFLFLSVVMIVRVATTAVNAIKTFI